MKKVLILVLSSGFPPYDMMITTSCLTWESIDVEGVETIFYCSQKDTPQWRENRNQKLIHFDVPNGLYDMGHKNLAMYEWALQNREFDFVCRVNASQYVNKKELIDFVQTIPETNLFAGAKVDEEPGWIWGGMGTLISRDVLEKMVQHKDQWNHGVMEDRAMSYLVAGFGIPFSDKYKSCSIDRYHSGEAWDCISYCGRSKTFTDFKDLKELGHIVYRIKQDGERHKDALVMQELFKALN